MTDAPWFPVDAHHPPPLAQVRGIVTVPRDRARGCYDAELIISRGKPPHTDTWASWERGRAIPLAPDATPCLWQPQFPDKWRMALPDPVPGVAPRMWSSTMRFQLVDDATAAELAEEMERDRADARAAPARGEGERPQVAWWRDADLIRYEPPGEITPRMAEGRIMRAVAMCEHDRGLTIRTRTFSDILAEMAARREDQPYATSDFVPRMKALPMDISDFDTAMAWFVALNPRPLPTHTSQSQWQQFSREQRVLIWRAMNLPRTFNAIAGDLGVSKQAAIATYARAIKAACRVANGHVAFPYRALPVDQIAALRERNRQSKRGVA